jgi:hypothetical protein
MNRRDARIYREASALWREVFHEPPPKHMGGAAMLDLIMRSREAAAYNRLRSPFLRPSTIVGPGQPTDENALS